jgi:hypothetical protein
MAEYRALRRGQKSDGSWVDEGEVFETDQPKGIWMEALEPEALEPDKPRRGRPPSTPE